MTTKQIMTLLGVSLMSLTISSCNFFRFDKQNLQDKLIPEKAKPSEEMTYGNLNEESHASEAVKYLIEGQDAPFESVELFGDGRYVIAKTGASISAPQTNALVRRTSKGLTVSIPKPSDASQTRAEYDYYIVGGYVMTEEGHYTLEDFGSLKVNVEDGETRLTFDNTLGNRICTVVATEHPTVDDRAAASLCRTWDVVSIEQWMYLGVLNILDLKYFGEPTPHFEGTGVDKMDSETLQDMIGETCSKVTFSPSGTYFCTYNNGKILYSTWMWANEDQGILFYDWEAGENEEGYITVRFEEDRCMLYEDYTIDLSGIVEEDEIDNEEFIDISEIMGGKETKLRYLILNTLRSAN